MTDREIKLFLEALKADLLGDKQYSQRRVDQVREAEGQLDPEEIVRRLNDDVDEALTAIGMVPGDIKGKQRQRTLQIMRMEGVTDPIDAYEKAVCENLNRKSDLGVIAALGDKVPGLEDRFASDDSRKTSMTLPNLYRRKATQSRAAASIEDAQMLDKLALMIELRDDAVRRADE